jgi:RNA polymerase sigma factor (sigma-70 family)
MLDTISGRASHPALEQAPPAAILYSGFTPGDDRRHSERRFTDRRLEERRSNSFALLPPGFVERRKLDRRIFDRRLADRRAKAFRPSSFNREALYQEFQPLVRRLIRQYGDCPELRQDLAGEIYYRFCWLLEVYDPGRGVPLKPYLVRQLTASVYTFARHGWIRQRREVSYDQKVEVGYPGSKTDPTPEWNHKLAMEQVIRSLPDAIANLPKRQRQVVVWRYYEQRPFADIAALLQVKPATARSLLRHGINSLRKHVQASTTELYHL